MKVTQQIARHVRDIHFGGNWTDSSFKDVLADVTWEEATQRVSSCNTIATLVFHMNFYLNAVLHRLLDKPFRFKHEDSFAVPAITSEAEWEQLMEKTWTDAETFAQAVEQFPEEKLWENISDQYGSFYKNLHGVVEHNHYHLGQIAVLKKILREGTGV